MVPVCNPSAQEVKAGRLGVQTQSELHSEKSQSKPFRTAVVYIIDQNIIMHIQGMGEWHLLSLSLSLCVIGRVTYYMFLICMHMRIFFLKIGSHVAQDDLDLTV